jgi:hypothetical protein
MVQHHKYSISELESMYPYERDLYVQMVLQYLKELKEQRENARY